MATRGRPRKPGARYPSGKLKDPGPNSRIVEARRTLLGADADEKVDLSKAENCLDLSLARGWLSPRRHRAARRYAQLWASHTRRHIPGGPAGLGSSLGGSQSSGYGDDPAARASGVKTAEDYSLQNALDDFEAGRITEAALRKAEKAHRSTRIDWSRLSSKEIDAIFTAALDLENYRPKAYDACGREIQTPELDRQDRAERDLLRRIWARLSADQARELFAVCVQESWPQWVIWRTMEPVAGLAEWLVWSARAAPWERKRFVLADALDIVSDEIAPGRRREPQLGLIEPLPSQPRRDGPVEVTNYVDPEGNLLRVVERRLRRPEPERG